MKEKVRFLGLDVHAETITAAVAEPDGEVRSLGTIANRVESIRKLVRKLGPVEQLRACYEAGPTGYVLCWASSGPSGSRQKGQSQSKSQPDKDKSKNFPEKEKAKTQIMNSIDQFEDRASSRRGQYEGEPSRKLCDRLSRTRDASQRQLPTDQDYAVSTREYQTDQSSPKPAPAAARPVLERRRKQKHSPHRCAEVDRSLHISFPMAARGGRCRGGLRDLWRVPA